MRSEDAAKAINGLNETRPTEDFEENIVVKLAHYDIGDIRNRSNWNKDNNQRDYPPRRGYDNSMYSVCTFSVILVWLKVQEISCIFLHFFFC